jgi:undecaprenyl-diphosphatase
MKSQRLITSLGTLLLLLFFVVSLSAHWKIFTQLDLLSMVIIQQYVPQFLDTPLSFFSLLGSFEVTTFTLLIVAFLRKKLDSMYAFFLYGLGLGIELFGKNVLPHPGPPPEFSRYDLGFHFPTSMYQTGNSLPSGHALRTTFIVTLLFSYIYQSKLLSHHTKIYIMAFLVVFLVIMLLSRISLGEHWISDVVAGTALGAGLAIWSTISIKTNIQIFPKFTRARKNKKTSDKIHHHHH